MSLNLATAVREHASLTPDRLALVHEDRSWTWDRFHGDVARLANGLLGLGLRRGQHVALMLPNIPEFTIAYYAAQYAGLTVVPLNVLLSGDEVAYHLEDSESLALLTCPSFLEPAGAGFAKAPQCRHLVVSNGGAEGDMVDFDALVQGSAPMTQTAPTAADDTAVILYTSGTTGRPKGAELTQFNMFYNADYSRTTLLPLDVDLPSALTTLPLFHSFGQTVIQNRYVLEGGTLVYLARFEARRCLELLAEHRIPVFSGVPTMFFALLHEETVDDHDLSALEVCCSGGAPMPVDIMRRFEERFGVTILEGYGLSETSPVASFNTLSRPRKPGSIGLPIAGVEFRLTDPDGDVIEGTDLAGEIEIKGHNVMKGYWRQPEATRESVVEGWFKTGDVATRDEDGYYYVVDRKKDMILRGGFNVYPREIEEFLYAHPAVAEVAVIGLPHEALGEEVCAVLTLAAGTEATEEEIIAYCKGRLGAYKYPRIVRFVDELPKGSTGKILKRVLRDQIQR